MEEVEVGKRWGDDWGGGEGVGTGVGEASVEIKRKQIWNNGITDWNFELIVVTKEEEKQKIWWAIARHSVMTFTRYFSLMNNEQDMMIHVS